ncbi:MAG: hypothetical protein M1825_000983 [Sarcosagium campestre]|nr:MAG: hypothetical protein M1825_000983 [Sarcosagium campestre]
MSTSIFPSFPPNQTSQQANYALSSLRDWCIANGAAIRTPESSKRTSATTGDVKFRVTEAPVTLFPSPFPSTLFQEAQDIQTVYNELYASISSDGAWLKTIVEELSGVDDFIAQLWQVHLDVEKIGYVQDLSLGLFRSDYMIHVDPLEPQSKPDLKQIEFNTIASSFGGLSSKVSDLHNHLYLTGAYSTTLTQGSSSTRPDLPVNYSIECLAKGIADAHNAYGPSKTEPAKPLCVIFIVQDAEGNIYDQRHIQYRVQSNHRITVFRLPFSQILDNVVLGDGAHRPLIFYPPHALTSPHEVSVVYYRAGYSPTEYVDAESWKARLLVESSGAIKCPSILTHLAGSKKVQQVLATPGSSDLERFLGEQHPLKARAAATFTNIYPLDATSEAGQAARKLALDPKTAERHVLKPQREGGGNNIYRAAIPPFLQAKPEAQWAGYILMELIEPPELHNILVRGGVPTNESPVSVISELGIFGTCLWRRDASKPRGVEILHNEEAGWLLRTKARSSEEGGVAAGFGALDTPLLM